MQTGSFQKLEGTVEVDETFVGGLEKNKHKDKKQNRGRGSDGKSVVLGVLNWGDPKQNTLHTEIKANVHEGAEGFTDAHRGY